MKRGHQHKTDNHAEQKTDQQATSESSTKRGRSMSGWISNISILVCGILFCVALAYWFSGNARAGFYWLIPACMALVIAVLSSYWYYVVKPAQSAHNELSATERPYIGVNATGVFNFVVGQKPTVIIEFKNTGNTPAFEFKVLGEVDVRWTPPFLPEETEYTDISKQQPQSVDTLNPTDVRRQTFTLPVLTQANIEALIAHKATAYFYGRVFYKDARGKRHLYLYCRFIDLGADGTNPTLVSCPYHNGESY
jgi:hypothetical protein